MSRKKHRSQACGGKVRYRDHAEAIRALHKTRSLPGQNGRVPIRCYECRTCGGFHLTSQEKRV